MRIRKWDEYGRLLSLIGVRPRTARQLAEQLGVSKQTIYEWVAYLRMKGCKIRIGYIREGKKGMQSKTYEWISSLGDQFTRSSGD